MEEKNVGLSRLEGLVSQLDDLFLFDGLINPIDELNASQIFVRLQVDY